MVVKATANLASKSNFEIEVLSNNPQWVLLMYYYIL